MRFELTKGKRSATVKQLELSVPEFLRSRLPTMGIRTDGRYLFLSTASIRGNVLRTTLASNGIEFIDVDKVLDKIDESVDTLEVSVLGWKLLQDAKVRTVRELLGMSAQDFLDRLPRNRKVRKTALRNIDETLADLGLRRRMSLPRP